MQRPGVRKKGELWRRCEQFCVRYGRGMREGAVKGSRESGHYLEDDEEPWKDSEQDTARVQGIF